MTATAYNQGLANFVMHKMNNQVVFTKRMILADYVRQERFDFPYRLPASLTLLPVKFSEGDFFAMHKDEHLTFERMAHINYSEKRFADRKVVSVRYLGVKRP